MMAHFSYYHVRNQENSDKPKPSERPANLAIRKYYEATTHLTEARLPVDGKEDWRTKSELPTTDEIFNQEHDTSDVLLLPNRPSGPWPSTELYLNAHYNLIREDAIGSLRDAVLWVRTYPDMSDTKTITIYDKVFMVQVTLANQGVAFRLQFSSHRAGKKIHWKYSSRLISGVIAARPLANLAKSPPEVDVFFAHPWDIDFDPQKEWIMVQARSGYYEAHRHTMTALQKLSQERFPLSQHICNLDIDVGAADYVTNKPLMDFQSISPSLTNKESTFNVLEDLPATPMAGLNTCQWKALRQILTKKISIIQGPPGTGKTHVSVVALKLLLSQLTTDDPPIIIATHTNHALDQLLSLIARSEDNYIRLGGRSGDADIRKRMLYEIRKSQSVPTISGGLLLPARNDLIGISTQIVNLLKPFSLENSEGPIKASIFREYGLLTQCQCDSIQGMDRWKSSGPKEDNSNHIAEWLDDQFTEVNLNHWVEDMEFTEDDIDIEYEELKELEAEAAPWEDEWEILRGRSLQFRATHRGVENSAHSKDDIQSYLTMSDLMKIPAEARGAIYNFLRGELLKRVNEKLRTAIKSYITSSKRYKIGRWERDFELLRNSKLIAMTTTGLSKYRGLIASLSPRTVLIEEAAEVLEAPTAVACFESIQQLILVGDHMQLKAKCTLQDLAGDPFFLDVSMFERLVQNDLPYVQLREQRRMAPEIRELLMPIYGSLHDHSSVARRPHIPGMGRLKTFFFTHTWPESGDSLSSKLNELEAIMVVEFYAYLMLNGISTFDMTVLTFYNGQKKLILKHMKTNQYISGHPLKVATVDSYQGEENEIVLLSLVRSSRNNGIGFLAVDNRVCVAMSRARRGLFLFGNSNTLEQSSQLWSEIVSILENSDSDARIGNQLPLTCNKHKNVTLIRELKDWDAIKGGCKEDCGGKLDCGHECPLKCHGFGHSCISCQESCSHVQLCCGASCTEICGRSHPHQCDCMAQQLGQMNLTGRESCLLKPLIPGTNGETRRQVIDSEKGVSRHILLSDGGTNLFIDPEISDDLNDELTRTKVGLWGNFVNDANAGTKDTVANRSHEVSWEDVQEGLEQATETFIHLNARRENPSSTFAPTSTDVAGTPSTKEPPTPVLADLIEFD